MCKFLSKRFRHELVYRKLVRATCTLLLACATLLFAGGAGAQVPEAYTGIWTEGDCRTSERFRLMSQIGILDVIPVDHDPKIQILRIEDALATQGSLQVTLSKGGALVLLDQTFTLEDGLLDGVFQKCPALPDAFALRLSAAAALFLAAGRAFAACENADAMLCVETAVAMLDVTADGQLSPAEIGRGLSVQSFFDAYAAEKKMIASLNEVGSAAKPGETLSIFVAQDMVQRADYDGNGSLSLDEILLDQGSAEATAQMLRSLLSGEYFAVWFDGPSYMELLKEIFKEFDGWLKGQ